MKVNRWSVVPVALVVAMGVVGCSESSVEVTPTSAPATTTVSSPTAPSTSAATGTSTATSTTTATQSPIGGNVITPVTMSVNELPGATVQLVVGQVLNINTDSMAGDSYSGEVADTSVATFSAGGSDGSAEFNPGVSAVSPGGTTVTMTNVQGGIEPLTFTVVVSPRN